MIKNNNIIVCQDDINKQIAFIQQIKERNFQKAHKYSLNTFGCQMNENDSERLAGMLAEMGYTETDDNTEADLIIFNTCCVRENAEQKVYGHLGALKKLKKDNPQIIISVCGCMMQQEEVVKNIKKKYNHVDLVFGTHNLYRFPELLCNAIDAKKTVVDIWESHGSVVEGLPIERKESVKAWVTIIYGCNNFCTYCVVPYVRGRERSRRIDDIYNEVMTLGQQGCKEVTLLGQNVNSYGKDIKNYGDFAKLLYEIDKIDGIERVRFMTSHPKDISDRLIYAMRDCKKVCEHLHLPIQAGSSRILRSMNRSYTKEQYLELVEKVRENNPGVSITTDIIVGFPGETEEDFNETLNVLERVRYDTAYTFLYSKRTGTPAAENPEQVSDEIKKERFQRLLELQNTISKEINSALVGEVVEILVEGKSKNSMRNYTGRTRTNKIVNFPSDIDLTGELVKIKIENAQTWSLEGKLI